MTKVCCTVHQHKEIKHICIEDVQNFNPDEYLESFLKARPYIQKSEVIDKQHNHYKVLLYLTNETVKTAHNTSSILLVWTE